MADIEVSSSGPVFDGRAEAAAKDFARAVGTQVAEQGVSDVRFQFAQVVQHPTGRYSRALHAVHRGSLHQVTDGGMVYGPWLAGEGSRNARSRFKGYQHWRRAEQQLERRVPKIANDLLPTYMRRMN